MIYNYDSPDAHMRGFYAEKETREEILEILSNDPYWFVRFKVAQNPNTSFKVIQKLSNDSVATVKNIAKYSLTMKRQIPPDNSWEFIEWAESMSPDELDKFIDKPKEPILERPNIILKIHKDVKENVAFWSILYHACVFVLFLLFIWACFL